MAELALGRTGLAEVGRVEREADFALQAVVLIQAEDAAFVFDGALPAVTVAVQVILGHACPACAA